MTRLRWQFVIVVLALIAIGILLLGQQPIVQQTVVVPEPASGGIYTEGLVGGIGRLNPLLDYVNPPDRDIDRLVYSSIIRFDDRGNPHPDLAEDWGVSLDGKTYNVTLREEAVWHDGEPVTTADVMFTIELMRDPEIPIASDLRSLWEVVEVVVFDERTMQFRLDEPFAPFLDYLTFGVLPEHLLGELGSRELIDAQFNLAPIGSGPYRFEQLLVEDGEIVGVVLTAFDAYYLERAFIDQVVFRYFSTPEEMLAAYREGEVLGMGEITGEIRAEAMAEADLNFYSGRLPRLSMILLHLDNPNVGFFQDATVRRALLTGLNRQWMVGNIMGGQAIVADGPVLPGTWAYYESNGQVAFDTNEAIKLLREAGYTIPAEGGAVRASEEGVLLSFELAYPDTKTHAALAEAIRQNWAVIGVEVELVAVDYETLMEDYLEPGIYEAALVDLDLTGSPDPDPYPFWHQAQATGGQNYSRWDDRRASEYLEQARVTVNVDERLRLYRNFQAHFSRELPALPLFYPVYTYGVDEQVQGVAMGPLFTPSDRFATITEWFLLATGRVQESLNPTATP